MTSGYILVVVILVLGGVIAASGDRIGTKVGKARLSLFNLRPKQTATLVTIVTGCLVAASTLGIIFGLSKPLRTGLFYLDEIQKKLNKKSHELDQVIEQKNQAERELAKARSDRDQAQKLLDEIDQSLKAATGKQTLTAAQLNSTKKQLQVVSQQKIDLGSEIEKLQDNRQELLAQRNQVKQQVNQLNAQVNHLNGEINQLKTQVNQRDEEISKQDSVLTERDRVIAQRQETEKRLKNGIAERETRLKDLEPQLQKRQVQLQEKDKQLQDLEAQLQQREAELQEKDKQRQDLEVQLQQREVQLQGLETQLQQRENQLANLEKQVGTLEQDYRGLRQGNVAVLRGQVLATVVLRIVEPTGARQAIDQLLSQANRAAIQATNPGVRGNNERVVQISKAQVEQLLNQIKDGRDYVVRILSVGNYIVGEKQVQVFADAELNQLVFSAGELIAETSADPLTMSADDIRKQIDMLLLGTQFRARRAGILVDTIQIGDGHITTLIHFLDRLKQYQESVQVQAVATVDTYTAGPLQIKLVATHNGQIVFST